MAFTSINGAAIFGNVIPLPPPIITAASFSTPTVLGSITISSITGKFTSYVVSRTGLTSTSQTGASFTDTGLTTNTQYTYTITPYDGGVAGTGFTTTTNPKNGSTPGKIYTLASCIAPTFASTTTTGTTLTCTGTFSKVNVTYSGTGNPASDTLLTGTNSVSQAYTGMMSSTSYTFTCAPVNGDNYQSTVTSSGSTTTLTASPDAPTNVYLYSAVSNGSTGITFKIGFTTSNGATSYTAYCGAFNTTGTTSPITISTTLALSTSYTIYVTATNSGGTSSQSTSFTSRTVTMSYTTVAFSRDPFNPNRTASSLATYNDANVGSNGTNNTLVNATTANAHVGSLITRTNVAGTALVSSIYVCNFNNTSAYGTTSNGGLNYATLGSTAVTAFTYIMWVNATSFNPTAGAASFFWNALNTTTFVGVNNGGFLTFSNNGTALTSATTGAMSTGTWYNIAFTFSSGTFTGYVNGTSVVTHTGTSPHNQGNNIFGTNGFKTFNGPIGSILYFNTTLSQSDIQMYMNILNG